MANRKSPLQMGSPLWDHNVHNTLLQLERQKIKNISHYHHYISDWQTNPTHTQIYIYIYIYIYNQVGNNHSIKQNIGVI